jgi:hypothetical protein
MAWMTAGRSITTSSSGFPARSGPGTSQRTRVVTHLIGSDRVFDGVEDVLARDAMAQRRAENLHPGIRLRNTRASGCEPPGDPVLPYRQGMPARKRPTPEDTMTARRVLLDGLARDADVFELVSELAPLHPRDNTFPGEVFLHVAAGALDWCRVSRSDPLPLEGLRERFLPECTFRGRENKKLQYAVLAAAALHGGTEPDLLEEVAWWQTDDFWQYALFAAVAYIRAAASRAGVPVRQACQDLAQRPGHPAP